MSPSSAHPRTDVSGHVILIAGAGSGIGAAVASQLAHVGAKVACLDRDGGAIEKVCSSIRDRGGIAKSYACDVTDTVQLERAVAGLEERWGTIQGLLNSVGITGRTGVPGHEIRPDEFEHVWAVNLKGAFVLSRVVVPRMLTQGYGRVLHIASIAGKEGNAGMVSYSASKAGLIGMVKSMGKDYAGSGVTFNALAPAVIETRLLEGMPQNQIDYMVQKIPMGRLGTLDEVADICLWALSPAASFITGFTFDLSGGRATY